MPFEFNQRNLILCEGSHDRAFFRALLSHLGLTKFQTTSPDEVLGARGGNTQWGRTLAAIIGTRKFETLDGLIIVVDNDDNPKQAVLSAQRAIITSPVFAGPPKRKIRRPQRTMFSTKGPPKVAIVPMPAVGQPGALESLCIQAAQTVVPATVIGCADQFIRCNGIDQWTTSKQAKVKMRAIIAASHKRNPEMTLSKLWEQRPDLVPVADPVFADIAAFLRAF
jgi:hypothetical protein